jgi:hypothetical protein
MKKIIFENPDKTIGVIHPTQEALSLFGIDSIAVKDTPPGLPFWIVDENKIPTDRANRNAWELDGTQGEPDGYGNETNTF